VEKYCTVRTSTRREKGEGNVHQEFVPEKMVTKQKKSRIIGKTIRIERKKRKTKLGVFGRDGGGTGASSE
jgi:hypothetical protein